jgi:hypothetical protein
MDLIISDISGRMLYRQSVQAIRGINTVHVSLPDGIQKPSVVIIELGNKDAHYNSKKLGVN